MHQFNSRVSQTRLKTPRQWAPGQKLQLLGQGRPLNLCAAAHACAVSSTLPMALDAHDEKEAMRYDVCSHLLRKGSVTLRLEKLDMHGMIA